MRRVEAVGQVALAPHRAAELWTDTDRWPTFVEGFARVLERRDRWPEPHGKLVWESGPQGRGRVTERVTENQASSGGSLEISSEVYEDRLMGTQTVSFSPVEDDRSAVALSLEYELTGSAPFLWLTDALFVRRAVRDSLRRTLGRFAVEAEEEAGFR